MLSPNIHKAPRCTHFILSFEPLHRSGHPRFKLRQVGRRGRCAQTATVFFQRRETAAEHTATGVVLPGEGEETMAFKTWFCFAALGSPEHRSTSLPASLALAKCLRSTLSTYFSVNIPEKLALASSSIPIISRLQRTDCKP